MAYTGKSWQLSTGTATYMGEGKILDAESSYEADIFSEPGTGGRQLATLPLTASALPRLRFTMNIRRLTDYVNTNAIITAEGTVPSHTLYSTDGVNPHDLTSAKVNTCEIRINRGESIKAIIEVIGKTWGSTAFQAGLARAEDPIDWTKATLSIAGASITNFRNMGFTVNNSVQAEFLGTTLTPTEVFERQAIYSGFVERSVTGADKFSVVAAGTKSSVVYAITNNETIPVTKTYTFSSCPLRVSRKPVRALDLDIERIEWDSGVLVIT